MLDEPGYGRGRQAGTFGAQERLQGLVEVARADPFEIEPGPAIPGGAKNWLNSEDYCS